MTSQEMKYELKNAVDVMYSGAAPGFSDKAYSVFLTEAQEDILREVLGYSITDKSRFTKRFDEDSLRRLGFSRLITETTLTPGLQVSTVGNAFRNSAFNSKIFTLGENYFYPILEIATVCMATTPDPVPDSALFSARIVAKMQKDIQLNLDNPFKNPEEDLIWKIILSPRDDGDGIFPRIELIYNTAIRIINVYFRYLSRPTPIIISEITKGSIEGYTTAMDSVLDPIYHRDIISRAATKVKVALNDTSGYQIAKIEEQ